MDYDKIIIALVIILLAVAVTGFMMLNQTGNNKINNATNVTNKINTTNTTNVINTTNTTPKIPTDEVNRKVHQKDFMLMWHTTAMHIPILKKQRS